jgi:hypothetical protein
MSSPNRIFLRKAFLNAGVNKRKAFLKIFCAEETEAARSGADTTLFNALGIALTDIAAATMVYKVAVSNGGGERHAHVRNRRSASRLERFPD